MRPWGDEPRARSPSAVDDDKEEGGEEEADEDEMRSEPQSAAKCPKPDEEMAPGGLGGEAGFDVHNIVLPGPAPGMSPIISGGTAAEPLDGGAEPGALQAAAAREDLAERSKHWSTEFSESRSKPDDEPVELDEFERRPAASASPARPVLGPGEAAPAATARAKAVAWSGGEPSMRMAEDVLRRFNFKSRNKLMVKVLFLCLARQTTATDTRAGRKHTQFAQNL